MVNQKYYIKEYVDSKALLQKHYAYYIRTLQLGLHVVDGVIPLRYDGGVLTMMAGARARLQHKVTEVTQDLVVMQVDLGVLRGEKLRWRML